MFPIRWFRILRCRDWHLHYSKESQCSFYRMQKINHKTIPQTLVPFGASEIERHNWLTAVWLTIFWYFFDKHSRKDSEGVGPSQVKSLGKIPSQPGKLPGLTLKACKSIILANFEVFSPLVHKAQNYVTCWWSHLPQFKTVLWKTKFPKTNYW